MLAHVAHVVIQTVAHAAHMLAFILPSEAPPPPIG